MCYSTQVRERFGATSRGARAKKREFSEVGQMLAPVLTLGLRAVQSEHVNAGKHEPTGEPTIALSRLRERRTQSVRRRAIKRGPLHEEKRMKPEETPVCVCVFFNLLQSVDKT